MENTQIGTIVGEFNATDPDINATLTYSLVTGAGDTNNYLFTLDTNGTLKSAAIFDYESNSSTFSIRVQVKDDENASMAGVFSVALLDYNEGVSPAAGDGSANNPYQIATLGNLRWLSITPSTWDDHILQVEDINASATKFWDNGIGFPSIGSQCQSIHRAL